VILEIKKHDGIMHIRLILVGYELLMVDI